MSKSLKALFKKKGVFMEPIEELKVTSQIQELGDATELTLGPPGPNTEYSPMGSRPLVHF